MKVTESTMKVILRKLSELNTVRKKVQYIKATFLIEGVDNEHDNVVILHGPSHTFYVSRSSFNEYTKELYYSSEKVDYISDDFSIAITRK